MIGKGNDKLAQGYTSIAIQAYKKAIKKDPNNLNAHHLLARALLTKNNKNNLQEAQEVLEKATYLIQHHVQPVLLSLDALIGQTGKKPRISEHVQYKLDTLFQQQNYIQVVLKALEIAQEQKWSVKITATPTLEEVCKDAEGDRTQAIAEAKLNGLHRFFIIEARQPVPYRSITAVACIGLVQISVGCYLASYSFGAAAPISQKLIFEGVTDLINAGSSSFSGDLSWDAWGKGKAISYAVSLGSAGVGYGIAQIKEAQVVAQTAAKTLEGVKTAVQNPGRWNTVIGRQGLQVAAKRVGIELGKGIAKECANVLIDYGIDTTLVPAIEQKVLKQVTKQITEALEKNDLVIELLAQDVKNQNNDWQDRLIQEGLTLLEPKKNNEWREISQAIAEGIASNQVQSIALILKGTKMAFASQKICTMTDNFLKKFDQQIITSYAAHRQKLQQKTLTTADQQDQTAQQQVASALPIDEDQIEVHPVHMDQDYKSDLLRVYYDTTSSSISQLARALSNRIASQMTQKIQGSSIWPITHMAVNMGIDHLLKDVERCVQTQEKKYQAEGDVHLISDLVASEENSQQDQPATDSPQDKEGSIAEAGPAAKIINRRIEIYNEHDQLIEVRGRNLPGNPIKIRHKPSEDGKSGHWEPYGTKAKVTYSGKNNCFYDAIACQVPGMNGAELRVQTENRIANSKYATDLQNAVSKLEIMNLGALRRGVCDGECMDPREELEISYKYFNECVKRGDAEAAEKAFEEIIELKAAIEQGDKILKEIVNWIPVLGSLCEAVQQYQKDNTGQAAFHAAMAAGEAVGVGLIVKGTKGAKLAWKGGKVAAARKGKAVVKAMDGSGKVAKVNSHDRFHCEGEGTGGGNKKTPPGDLRKLKNGQGWKDKKGNIWKKDKMHQDHWDVTDPKTGKKIKEVDFNGNQIWPDGPKNKGKK
ncbi:MAG: tetratricopeptide repeat protein [Bacteroidota bacterium]